MAKSHLGFMVIFLFAFLIGCVCGLRSMTAPAVIAWGAHRGWLHLEGSWLEFFTSKITLVVFSLFALGELVADKLPFIPGRCEPGPLSVRAVFGGICGAALCYSSSKSLAVGAILGALGGVAGAFAGFNYRRLLSRGSMVPDLLIALVEDAVAVAGGLFLVSHL